VEIESGERKREERRESKKERAREWNATVVAFHFKNAKRK